MLIAKPLNFSNFATTQRAHWRPEPTRAPKWRGCVARVFAMPLQHRAMRPRPEKWSSQWHGVARGSFFSCLDRRALPLPMWLWVWETVQTSRPAQLFAYFQPPVANHRGLHTRPICLSLQPFHHLWAWNRRHWRPFWTWHSVSDRFRPWDWNSNVRWPRVRSLISLLWLRQDWIVHSRCQQLQGKVPQQTKRVAQNLCAPWNSLV